MLPPMEWTSPTWAEIKMDAEIGSYQEDFDTDRDPRFVKSVERTEECVEAHGS
jgi:hypothetical protein